MDKFRSVFFDRDGVINESPDEGYVTRWEEFRFREGIREVLRLVSTSGYRRILITNQQGVGKALMTAADLRNIHDRMQAELVSEGLAFDAIYAAVGLEGRDPRRKPRAEMFNEAARDHNIDLVHSWMIGDDDKDVQASRIAGVRSIRMLGDKPMNEVPDHVVADFGQLHQLLKVLLKRTEGGS